MSEKAMPDQNRGAQMEQQQRVDILATARSGDLVLFSGKGFSSGAVRFFTGSRWSHVGMVLRDEGGRLLLLEATTTVESADIGLGRPVRGVQVVDLAQKLRAYDGAVALRCLQLDERPAGLDEELQEIAELWRYRGYKDFAITLMLDVLSANRRPQRVHRVFCSELVAEIYKRVGLMGRQLRSSRYVPGDFGLEEVPFLRDARLLPPVLLKG